MKDHFERLTREQLMELVEISAKNLVALDSVWFQAVEQSAGMDAAMDRDEEAWQRFPKARRAGSRHCLAWTTSQGSTGWSGCSAYATARLPTTRSPCTATSTRGAIRSCIASTYAACSRRACARA